MPDFAGKYLQMHSSITAANTIRILVATDNHVGYEERDAIRKDDSWRTFDEIMNLARTQDVDMVLLAGDLFHDNKPSRKSLYQVIRTLRKNCLGMKPCALEFLSDAATVFEGAFAHVNYEDPDINISIPVFSIHGNHDDPSGDGNYCSLDLLQAAGLVNYFGRVAEADNIQARPILLRKGDTRLALYGLSNVRDERMFRTFRDHRVKWFRPAARAGSGGGGGGNDEWFSMLAVHQNHHPHSATSYLPESVLPDWLHLVVWGHEHECRIDPARNAETGFHVMQPGSSVATSLVPGEAAQKHVAVVSVCGTGFKVDKIPLKTVRPFVTREIALAQDKRFRGLDRKKDNRQEITRGLMEVVEEMIDEANASWDAIQTDDEALEDRPLPLIRLKVEYTAQDGGEYECENPQRFSHRFVGKVANVNDVVFFHRRKAKLHRANVTDPTGAQDELGDDGDGDSAKVDSLVQQFLSAQSLKVLPQGPFGEAVNQFVSKDDKHAMELFVSEHLSGQVKQMLGLESDDEDLNTAMEVYRAKMEQQLAAGPGDGDRRQQQQQQRKRVLRPKPATWDSDFDGRWEDEPDAWVYEDVAELTGAAGAARGPGKSKGKGKGRSKKQDDTPGLDEENDDDKDNNHPPARTTAKRGAKKAAAAAAATKAPAAKKAPARKRRTPFPESEEDEDDDHQDGEEEEDVIMDSNEEEEAPAPARKATTRRGQSSKAAPRVAARGGRGGRVGRAPRGGGARQTKLNFTQQSAGTQGDAVEISDDEVSDDSAFEAAPVSGRTRRR
ncbi:Double-strand break repair protein mus-23 [Escovopsis weberi]|uniref:Double-strand break repair protein n=1 Tax=Escovopsis weberi TaxID=150374 RepID=A0A0M8N9Q9_ESCWE|nr:Double-strand break repair protein mus-23 [Escovopsis weberi]